MTSTSRGIAASIKSSRICGFRLRTFLLWGNTDPSNGTVESRLPLGCLPLLPACVAIIRASI